MNLLRSEEQQMNCDEGLQVPFNLKSKTVWFSITKPLNFCKEQTVYFHKSVWYYISSFVAGLSPLILLIFDGTTRLLVLESPIKTGDFNVVGKCCRILGSTFTTDMNGKRECKESDETHDHTAARRAHVPYSTYFINVMLKDISINIIREKLFNVVAFIQFTKKTIEFKAKTPQSMLLRWSRKMIHLTRRTDVAYLASYSFDQKILNCDICMIICTFVLVPVDKFTLEWNRLFIQSSNQVYRTRAIPSYENARVWFNSLNSYLVLIKNLKHNKREKIQGNKT
jgi:hypothetical protein